MLAIRLRRQPLPHRHLTARTIVDLSAVKPVRDRALDHAVEKEHHLIPLLSLKHLLKSSPSNSLPLSVIRSSLDPFPARHIDFIRRYPAVFEEYSPAGIHPHIKLTPQTLTLHEEEQMVINGETHLLESANRVLKLLMIANSNTIPLPVIERLRFDLGLPHDFVESVIPNFPDYFRVSRDELELVCWNGDLSVSVIEKGAKNYEKGMPMEFPMKFSTGFEMEKKFKKWVDEWQKLPYISPYENAMHLSAKSDEGDKWVVSVLHEVLSLLYSKKTDRENLLFFGECLGLRTRIRQALLHHPGIFYISRKGGSHTVVLRDGYKRDLLVQKHPLMDIRYKYIHLMNTVTEDKKKKVELDDNGKERKQVFNAKAEDEEKVDGEEREVEEASGSEVDDESEDDYDDEDEEDENENESLSNTNGHTNRVRANESSRFEGRRDLRTRGTLRSEGKTIEFARDRSKQRRPKNYEDNNTDDGRKFSNNYSHANRGRTRENRRFGETRAEFGRDEPNQRRARNYEAKDEDEGRTYSHTSRGNRGRTRDNPRFEGKRNFKSSDESGRDGLYQRRTRNYEDDGPRVWKRDIGEKSERKGFNDQRNNRGRSKESRYKKSSRSGTEASA